MVNNLLLDKFEAHRTYSLVVDNLDNGGKSAIEGVVAVDDNDSANLNAAPVRSLNVCVAHLDGDLCSLGQSRILEWSFCVVFMHNCKAGDHEHTNN